MEFFVQNWIWFLVASIVILMTLIGYLAEKTDFGRRDIPSKENNKKGNNKKEIVEETFKEDIEKEEVKPEVQMTLATDSILEEETQGLEFDENRVEAKPEELEESFDNNEFEQPQNEENIENQDLIEEVVSEEQPDELKLDDVKALDIELPDLDTIVSEEDDDDSDDIWKF